MTLFPPLEDSQPSDALALVCDDVRLTWRELAARVAAHQSFARNLGLTPGAIAGVWTQPTLETLVAFIAHASLGIVSVPLDPKLGSLELKHVLDDAKPRVTFAADVEGAKARLPAGSFVSVEGVATEPLAHPASCAPVDDTAALLLYTSGTTGLPKGAVISRHNIAANLDALATAWRWTSRDLVVHALPMFHVHGLVLGLFGAMRRGGTLHWLTKFDIERLTQALVSDHRPTMLFAVPTMYHRLAVAAQGDARIGSRLSCPRVLVSGSAGLAAREHQRLFELTGRHVIERYGLTETLINCSVRVEDAPMPGYVGRPLDDVALRLVDEQGQVLPVRDDSTIGEVQVRGPNVFRGYLNRADATAAAFTSDGWFATGDLACQRADGAVRIVGRRATDLIKCGGYKVGAGEVEAALLEHPQVLEAAVVATADADLGERIVAFVVASSTDLAASALEQFVAAQLSPHKRPREVHLVEALPRNAMGKVLKHELKRRLG